MFYIIIHMLEGISLSSALFMTTYSLYCISAGLPLAMTCGAFYWIISEIRKTSEIRVFHQTARSQD